MLSVLLCAAALGCSGGGSVPDAADVPYVPPVVFEGCTADTCIELRGSRAYPNSARLSHDTVYLVMRSSNYNASKIPGGIHMALTVYPQRRDSLRVGNANTIGTGDVLFHFVNQIAATCSYYVLPEDSMPTRNVSFSAVADEFSRAHGAALRLKDIKVSSNPTGSFCGQYLEITSGTITGAIE